MSYESRFIKPSQEECYSLSAIVVLDKMIKKNRPFCTLLEGDDTYLEQLLDFLVDKEILELDLEKGEYVATQKGNNLYKNFLRRYKEYLTIFDIFCAVDLDEGSFGFEKYFDYSEEIFLNFINEDRFVDLRVTVCEFKKMQTLSIYEIVFISFLLEKRFREPRDRSNVMGTDSWQYQCYSGQIFEEIVQICNGAPHFNELGYEDNQGRVSGHDVLCDVIEQGTQLAREIAQKLHEQNQESVTSDNNHHPEVVETHHYEPEYYGAYYDPYYRSPLWDVALLGLILL